MEQFSRLQIIPSCTLSKSLLVNLEKRVHHKIPHVLEKMLTKLTMGLGLQSYEKLESFRVIIEEKKKKKIFTSATDLTDNHFKASVKQVRVTYRLAAPKILFLEIVFSRKGHSYIRLESQSPQIEDHFSQLLDNLCGAIDGYANLHRLLHNRLIRIISLLVLPAACTIYGLFAGIDLVALLFSMGWLCLLSLGVFQSLQSLYPWVTFKSKSLIELHRLPMLASLAVWVVAVGLYLTMVMTNLPYTHETQFSRMDWLAWTPAMRD